MSDLPDFVVPRGPVPWTEPGSDPPGDVRRALAEHERLAERARLDGDVLTEGHHLRQLERLRPPAPTWQEAAAEAFADAARSGTLVAAGGFCAPADTSLYALVDRAPWTRPDPSWWWDCDVDAWLFPRLTAARRALHELRRRLVVAARVLHHGYGWRAEPPTGDDD